MQAVVFEDFSEGAVRDVPRPEPGPDDVLLAVNQVQLSVTECWVYNGIESAYFDVVKERLAEGDGRLFGHEFAATVVETGQNVSRFEVGERVYAPGRITCGDCPYCEAGYSPYCQTPKTIGFHTPGALAEYLATPTEPLAKLPDEVTDAEGAAMQPFTTSMLSVHDADISAGDVVAVVGAGVMGYQSGQVAQLHGADRVYAIDISESRLELAASKGMIPIDATTGDPVEAIVDRTGGIGADVVIEAVGGEQEHATEGDSPLAQAFRMVRKGGKIVQVGIMSGEMRMTPFAFRAKNVRWINPTGLPTGPTDVSVFGFGPNESPGEHAAGLVASGRASIEENVTHELSGLGAFEDAIEITLNKDDYGANGPAQIVVDN